MSRVDRGLALVGLAFAVAFGALAAPPQPRPLRGGSEFQGAEIRAMQADTFGNPEEDRAPAASTGMEAASACESPVRHASPQPSKSAAHGSCATPPLFTRVAMA